MVLLSSARRRARGFHKLASIGALTLLFVASSAQAQGLSLSDVLGRVSAADPYGDVTGARIRAGEASVRQARVGPRPVVGLEIEDFAGTGPYSPFNRSQTTAYYERPVERGAKREARVGAAESELAVTRFRGMVRTLDLVAQVQMLWVEALAAQAAVSVAEERLAFAQRNAREVGYRVDRAVDPLFADERAKTAVAQAQIALDQAVEAARIARANLAAMWSGSDGFQLDMSAFWLTDVTLFEMEETPDIALLIAERDVAGAKIRLVQTLGTADPTFRVGVRHFGEGNEAALIVGGSIPLGSRRANTANIDRARSDQTAAEGEISLARVERKREIDRLVAERRAIATEVGRIDREVLPLAERTVSMVRDGFNRGGTAFTLLELAESQRVVSDARARRIELLRRFHLAGARLDRLTGRHASLFTSAENR
ncbi:TolC family protein [Sphingomonas sp.]|jgi:cobalt-zinc-cadmium efflux system outer membrane protein|uniref:TolC family protein n=1 Tax=Sphingomonas sp. TaxID=28214 RepID=UPI002EDA64E4